MKSSDDFILQRMADATVAVDSLAESHSEAIALLRSYMTPMQREFVEDPHRFKVARCGRRGGKSVMDAIYLIIRCLEGNRVPTLYLGLTQDSAKKTMWPILLYFLERLNIPFDPKISGPVITFENGSYIQLFGADASNARERLRGRHFALVVIDEMGFFTEGDLLIQSLIPMLADYQGTVCMTSSPGYLLSGLFYDADVGAQSSQWKSWHWTMRDNPHFQKPSSDPRFETIADEEFQAIADLLYGGDQNHPAFRREYLGEWIADATSLIYHYLNWEDRPGHNVVEDTYELMKPQYGIGIDLGEVSSNAIVVLQYSHYSREAVVVDVWKEAGVGVEELYGVIKSFMNEYEPSFMVADMGGYGKGVLSEIKRRWGLNIEAADKTDKQFHQRIFGSDLTSGYIKMRKNAGLPLAAEWDKICRGDDGAEIRGQENHAADACLYIYRKLYQLHLSTYEKPKTEAERMEEYVEAAARRDKQQREDNAMRAA